MDGERILLTNVQRFSLHDGPGIRTTVFLKGCSLHCPWCANPENIRMCPENYQKDGISGTYGRYVTTDKLFEELLRDRMFYGAEGGVTFSGGEPLLQMGQLEPLMARLQRQKIHMCAETSLFVPQAALEIAMRYIQLFYVDCKILDDRACKEILGGNISLYEENLKNLRQSQIPVVLRLPVIGGYTDSLRNMDLVLELIEEHRPAEVELLKEHNLGASKYISLGLKPPSLIGVADELLDAYRQRIDQLGIPVKICAI